VSEQSVRHPGDMRLKIDLEVWWRLRCRPLRSKLF